MDYAPDMNGAFYQYEEKDSSSNTQKIPRPPNAFMMFAREYRPVLLNKTPNVENKFISIKLGQMWKSMTAQQKAKYFYMAKLAEQRHRQMYPEKFMKDTLACPCLAFLSCNEEFALKMGWKPGEMTSFQNFVKSRLSSIVGENGITGPCTTSPVNCAQQEAAAPVTKEETSSDTSASDSSSALEDTSSNSMNTFSFPDTPSNITCGANDSTEGN